MTAGTGFDDRLAGRLVFLVGAPRSGTNWLERMVGTHPDVVTLPGETQLFNESVDVLADRVQHGLLGSTSTATLFMDRAEFVQAVRRFTEQAFAGIADRLHPGAERIVERSPNHVERLELLGEIFPDAWFLHIVRDGRDVARSLLSQRWGPTSMAAAAEQWARSIRSARRAAEQLERYHEVRYEDLLSAPGPEVAGIFRWMGLAADDDLVARVLAESGVPFNTDPRRPAIGRDKWRADWGPRDIAAFERVAGDLVRDLGYPPAAPAASSRRTAVASVGRARRRLSGAAGREAAPAARPYLPLEVCQRRVDGFCAALSSGDLEAAVADLAPAALVRVVTAERDERARADAGRRLLAGAIAADPPPWGRQQRGDVHVAGTMFTVVTTHAVDGGRTDRSMVVTFDDRQQISSVVLYRFPL